MHCCSLLCGFLSTVCPTSKTETILGLPLTLLAIVFQSLHLGSTASVVWLDLGQDQAVSRRTSGHTACDRDLQVRTPASGTKLQLMRKGTDAQHQQHIACTVTKHNSPRKHFAWRFFSDLSGETWVSVRCDFSSFNHQFSPPYQNWSWYALL